MFVGGYKSFVISEDMRSPTVSPDVISEDMRSPTVSPDGNKSFVTVSPDGSRSFVISEDMRSPTPSPDGRKSLMKNEDMRSRKSVMKNEIQKSKQHEDDDDKSGASLEDNTQPELMASAKRKSQGDNINVSPNEKIKLENQLMARRKRKPQMKDIRVENQTDSREITGPEPQLDDDIIREILPRLPTKSSVLMSFLSRQWQSVLSALPTIDLDFNEEGEPVHDDSHHLRVRQHANYINMFSWFVDFREKDKQKQQQLVGKFRIRMVRYSLLEDEATVVDKWLRFALERSVKELDIGLFRGGGGKVDYCIPQTLCASESLTTLKLEHVTVSIKPYRPVSLPSLKTLSLISVCIDGYSSFASLILPAGGCLSPSLENLSIVSCSTAAGTDKLFNIRLSGATLRSLKVVDWHAPTITATAKNLESVTIVSDSANFRCLGFYGCPKVEYMDIRAQCLRDFSVFKFSQRVKEPTLDTPNLIICRYDNNVCDRRYLLSCISAKPDA